MATTARQAQHPFNTYNDMEITMSQKTTLKPLAIAAGAALATSLAATAPANAAENPFAMSELSSGYMVAEMNEGKCGAEKKAGHEGKCGAEKKADKEGKCGEGKCGAEKKEGMEGKCGAEKKMDKEGKCGAKE
jgi:uncharacterized low-complexity protein